MVGISRDGERGFQNNFTYKNLDLPLHKLFWNQ